MRRLAGIMLFLALGIQAYGQTPTLINYQGRLLDGTNLVNGTVSMALFLYNSPSGGGFQYEDTGSVVVVDGLYSTYIGDGTAAGTLTNALTQTNVYIEVEVNGVTLAPRERLASAAYALRSLQADKFGGAIADSQLSTNVARLNGSQAFSGPVTFNNPSNVFVGTFSGSGTGAFAGAFSGTVAGNLSGNGAGVTNVALVGDGAAITNVDLASIVDPNLIPVGRFSFATNVAAGLNPRALAAVDVNADGKVDLLCANSSAGTVSVLTNNGYAEFSLSASPSVGNNPDSLTVADVTGDGKVDMIVANDGSGTLTVMTNNGSGGFVSNASPAVGSATPVFVTAADVTGDGKIDLITANYLSNTLTVMTNRGTGTFFINATITASGNPVSVAAADVTGDGKVDLITANSSSSSLTVFTNNGTGTFVSNATYTVGSTPFYVIAAAINGDTRMDLVCANYGSDTISVLTNNGSGGFAVSSTHASIGVPDAVAAADVNGDGFVDVVSANYGGYTLNVWTNNGSGNLVLVATVQPIGAGPRAVAIADLDGDGDMDLVSANEGPNTLTLVLNRPGYIGSFSGDGSGLSSAAGWVRYGTNIDYSVGNVGIGTTTPSNKLQVAGSVQATAYITASDRNLKENIQPVAADDILAKVSALPISTWNFKTDSSGTHLGPMAQDFHAAFGLGNTDSGIFTVDADGVALAAIQALAAANAELKSQLDALKERLDALESAQPPPN